MTTRELRNLLFNVENQNLTVKELRALLFETEEQDKELTETEIARITRK